MINREIKEDDPQEEFANKLIIEDYISKRKESRKDRCSSYISSSAIFVEKNSLFEQIFTSIKFKSF